MIKGCWTWWKFLFYPKALSTKRADNTCKNAFYRHLTQDCNNYDARVGIAQLAELWDKGNCSKAYIGSKCLKIFLSQRLTFLRFSRVKVVLGAQPKSARRPAERARTHGKKNEETPQFCSRLRNKSPKQRRKTSHAKGFNCILPSSMEEEAAIFLELLQVFAEAIDPSQQTLQEGRH